MRALIYRAWMKRPGFISGQSAWIHRYNVQCIKRLTAEVMQTRAMLAAMLEGRP